MSKGAQPSDSAAQVLRSAGYFERYERFKQGEPVEALLADAQEAEKARNTNPKTSAMDVPASKAK